MAEPNPEAQTTNTADPHDCGVRPYQVVYAYCFGCDEERPIEAPEHPSGAGRCLHCNALIDLADFNPGDVR